MYRLLILGLFLWFSNTGYAQFNSRIAYVWEPEHDGQFYLYSMNPDGSDIKRLTAYDAILFSGRPTWSPDGQRLAFPDKGHLFAIQADGSNRIQLTQPVDFGVFLDVQDHYSPTWSPDGQHIAYYEIWDIRMSSPADIWVMNADGSNHVNLGEDSLWGQRSPAWSPDGGRLAFQYWAGDSSREIYLMNADGTDWVNLTNHPAQDSEPAWSPDGTRIAFVSDRRDESGDIWIMNADGSEPINLTPDEEASQDLSPTWSPDGRYIAFWRWSNPSAIYVVNVDGSGLRKIADGRWPAWSPFLSANPTSIQSTTWGQIKEDVLSK